MKLDLIPESEIRRIMKERDAARAELADSRAGYAAMNQRIYGVGGESFELDKARTRIAALEAALRQMKSRLSYYDTIVLTELIDNALTHSTAETKGNQS